MFLSKIFENYGDGERIKFNSISYDGKEVKIKNEGVIINEDYSSENNIIYYNNEVFIVFDELNGIKGVSIKSNLEYFYIDKNTNETTFVFKINKRLKEENERNENYENNKFIVIKI